MGDSNRTVDQLVRPPGAGVSVVLASLAINLLALVLPVLLLQVFDRIIPYQSNETMAVLFWTLVTALTLDFVLKVARILILGHSSALYEIELTHAATERMLRAESHEFLKHNFGSHTDRLAAIRQLRDYYGGQGRLLRIDLPFTAIFVGMIWFIGGWLVVVPLGCMAAIVVASQFMRKWQERTLEDRHSVDQRRYSFLAEIFERIMTIKALSAEDQMLRRFELLQDQSARASASLIQVASMSQSFGAVFGQVSVVAMGAVGGWMAIEGSIGMAELAACMLLNGRTTQPMLKLLGLWVQLEGVNAAKRRMQEIAALPAPVEMKRHDGSFAARIAAKNLTVKPAGRKHAIFEDLTFEIEPGQLVGIEGDDGSGRSSLMRVILGEQNATNGQINIGGHPPGALLFRRGVGEIAYVDQEPAIFNGTIFENISLFGKRAQQDSALYAAERIGLSKDVFALPLGYDTVIGPGAQSFLPTGALQKICIARVLGRRPSLLLFNNGASAIDGAARQMIRNELIALKGRTTMIVASQRLFDRTEMDQTISLVSNSASSRTLESWAADAKQEQFETTLRLGPGAQESA